MLGEPYLLLLSKNFSNNRQQICYIRTLNKNSRKTKTVEDVRIQYKLPKVLERLEENSRMNLRAEFGLLEGKIAELRGDFVGKIGEIRGDLKGQSYQINFLTAVVLLGLGGCIKFYMDSTKISVGSSNKTEPRSMPLDNEFEKLRKLLLLEALKDN
uniref:Uncharacterized protein n=2 Tax=Meloidogyne TaxID=189290 RepID=A0A914LMG7_MELIC